MNKVFWTRNPSVCGCNNRNSIKSFRLLKLPQKSGSFGRGWCRWGRRDTLHFCSANCSYICSWIRGCKKEKRRNTKKSEEKQTKSPKRKKNEKKGEKSLQPSQSASGGGTEGGAMLLHFNGSPDPFSCSKMSLFYLKTCTPVNRTP